MPGVATLRTRIRAAFAAVRAAGHTDPVTGENDAADELGTAIHDFAGEEDHQADHKAGGSDDLLAAPGPIGGTTPGIGNFAAGSVIANESLTEPTLQNSWVNFGSGFNDCSYYKDAVGIVHIVGLIKNGTTTNGVLLFTLNSGYRPSSTNLIDTISNNGVLARLDIATDGTVRVKSPQPSNVWFSLDNIHFRAA